MADIVNVKAVNFDELQQAFAEAPAETYRFLKTELFRFARRARKKFINERMKGRPGIVGGILARGKNVQAFQTGNDLASLKAVNKISRILRVHEEGAVITARKAAFLFLSKKSGRSGEGKVFARVKSVTIPARLGFEALWRREVPDGQNRIHEAMQRAMRVVFDRRVKAVSSAIEGFANG